MNLDHITITPVYYISFSQSSANLQSIFRLIAVCVVAYHVIDIDINWATSPSLVALIAQVNRECNHAIFTEFPLDPYFSICP